ncbi:MAG: polysaccharide deacetylase family protein [Bacteroidales bacterium]|nr:polysaccharide deacetylase family protein [Clostridium sp.]MCM1205003.1 polysaccharide deacetylase family protein [Bacteroidales bacterium]
MNIQKITKRFHHIRRELFKKITAFRDKNNYTTKKQQTEKKGGLLQNWSNTPHILYPAFIIGTSVFCILLSQFSPNSRLRSWYYELTNKPIINKGIASGRENEKTGAFSGQFLTHYRYGEFGASDPAEIDLDAPMIALTFDDGPNPQHTQRILEVLTENYSHATFFVVGTNAENYPDTLKAILSSGSEIGNHTYSHTKLTALSSDEVEEEIGRVNRAVKKATGENTTVIRPPYGDYDDNLLNQLQEPVVLWDLDTEDWDSRNAQTIVDAALSQIKDGDIVLMHDIYESTAEAVELLVPRLKEQGYQILSVSELAHYKGKSLELGKAYGGFKKE